MKVVIRCTFIILNLVFLVSCATNQIVTKESDSKLFEIVKNNKVQDYAWVDLAAEYDGMTIQVYNTAMNQLDDRINSTDSALFNSKRKIDKTSKKSSKTAIVVDLDETIISSIELQKQFHANGKFNDDMLVKWMMQSRSSAISGALEFLQKAAKKGVTIFYVSNRRRTLETATRLNLKNLGFPLLDDIDTVLMRYEQKDWSSDKTSRWLFIEENYRIIMQFGDSLNDFIYAKKMSPAENDQAVKNYQEYWGDKWFLLPNPLYGHWEKMLEK